MKLSFEGRVAIVTGAGSGIGRSVAVGLSAAGATVFASDIISDRALETAELIREQGGVAFAATTDVADAVAVADLVSTAILSQGQIDILCNNAGIVDRTQAAADVALEVWDRVIAVNTTGPFLMAKAVLPYMLARNQGVIVNTISVAGIRGGAAGLAYTVSKHGLVGLTRNIAVMYGRDGIRCNGVCAGPTHTDIGSSAGGPMDDRGVERLKPTFALMGETAEPQAIANSIIFLASDAASFVNGAILPVDGGWSAA